MKTEPKTTTMQEMQFKRNNGVQHKSTQRRGIVKDVDVVVDDYDYKSDIKLSEGEKAIEVQWLDTGSKVLVGSSSIEPVMGLEVSFQQLREQVNSKLV